MKQTAVEWFGKELESYGDPQFCEIKWETLDKLVEQAKEMEKEQLKSEQIAKEHFRKQIKMTGEINLAKGTIIDEIWYPTMELRFLEIRGIVEENYTTTEIVLQQLFMSDYGSKEWRDIPTETI